MTVGIEVNPSAAHGAGYAAKGIFGVGILINPSRIFGMNVFMQNNKVAHEFRHLQLVNYLKLVESSGNYNPYTSPAEVDAREYAEKLFPMRQ
jgi:hypothetical protein